MRAPKQLRSKLGALSLAITFLVVQLGGAWHLARQEHARCAEHGEWLDIRNTDFLAAATPSAEEGPRFLPAATVADHDHCVVAEASRVRAVVWDATPATWAVDPSVSIAVPPIEAPLGLGFARYLLAPKQSPPC